MQYGQVETFCLSLKGAVSDRPFGPSLQTFKIAGKIFAILSDDGGLTIKLSDVAYEVLLELGRMRRAPYLPRGGWANTQDITDWDEAELSDLIVRSYEQVVAGLTKKTRAELGL